MSSSSTGLARRHQLHFLCQPKQMREEAADKNAAPSARRASSILHGADVCISRVVCCVPFPANAVSSRCVTVSSAAAGALSALRGISIPDQIFAANISGALSCLLLPNFTYVNIDPLCRTAGDKQNRLVVGFKKKCRV